MASEGHCRHDARGVDPSSSIHSHPRLWEGAILVVRAFQSRGYFVPRLFWINQTQLPASCPH